MSNKQSSVDWLIEQFYSNEGMITTKQLEKAKAMHKEEMIQNCAKMQIIDDVDFDGNVTFIFDPEQYYNETYGGNK